MNEPTPSPSEPLAGFQKKHLRGLAHELKPLVQVGGSGVSDEDTDNWAIGLDHNFSKRTKAYILYTDWENDDWSDSEYDVFSLGLRHAF